MAEARDLKDIFNGSIEGFTSSGPKRYALLGNVDATREDAIAIFFKPITVSEKFTAYHTYIFCSSHRQNTQFIFRGGPASDVEPVHSFIYFLTGATPPPDESLQTFGYLFAQLGTNEPYRIDESGIATGSPDWNGDERSFGVVIKKGDDLRDDFIKLKDHLTGFNALKIRYNPQYPNSNTYVHSALNYAGLPDYLEAVASYPEYTENKELFSSLFVPGYAPLDLSKVVYDHGRARSIEQRFGTDFGETGVSSAVEQKLAQDNANWRDFPQGQALFNPEDQKQFDQIESVIKNLGEGKVYVIDVPVGL